jgi:hypothetical protein
MSENDILGLVGQKLVSAAPPRMAVFHERVGRIGNNEHGCIVVAGGIVACQFK